jgi:methylenetetrahydrofolate--tRNA-(uracil-5-)-methyltransferase
MRPPPSGEPEGAGRRGRLSQLAADETQYRAFVRELLAAEKVVPHAFEEPRYFEGCLPIEVMAERARRRWRMGR